MIPVGNKPLVFGCVQHSYTIQPTAVQHTVQRSIVSVAAVDV